MMPTRGAVAGAGDSSDGDSDAPLLPKWSYVTALINRFGDAHGFESLQKARPSAGTRHGIGVWVPAEHASVDRSSEYRDGETLLTALEANGLFRVHAEASRVSLTWCCPA